MELGAAQLKFIPAPTGGWNARDPIASMPETDAVSLINFFPAVASVKPRGGQTKVFETDDANDDILQLFNLGNYIFALYTDDSAGVQKLTRMLIGTYTGTDVSGAVTFDVTQYNWTVFKNRIFACNSTSSQAPFDVTTSGNASTTAWSGSGLTTSNLYQVDVYKGRLYFVELGTSKIWYGGLDSITGTLTEYNIGLFMRKGGYITAVASTTKQGGAANENLFVAITSLGEVFVFEGDYPGSSTWQLVARYEVSPPLGPRCFTFKGSDLLILTVEGIIPMNALLTGTKNGDRYSAISDKISDAWFKTFSQLVGININPVYALHAPTYKMFVVDTIGWGTWVQNTLTGAWCKFVDYTGSEGTPGSTPGWSDRMIAPMGYLFGRGGANTIIKLETPDAGVTTDFDPLGSDLRIKSVCRHAFSFLDDMAHAKQVVAGKAFFKLTQDTGHDQSHRSMQIGIDSDFDDTASTYEMLLRDVTADGTVNYSLPCDLRAQGTAFSLKYNCQFGDGYALELNGFILAYEAGGYLNQ